jgi:hypothetical protein
MIPVAASIVPEGLYLQKDIENLVIPALLLGKYICTDVKNGVAPRAKPRKAAVNTVLGLLCQFISRIWVFRWESISHSLYKSTNVEDPDSLSLIRKSYDIVPGNGSHRL